MATASDIDRLLQRLAYESSRQYLSNGAVVFHISNSSTPSLFKKKDISKTVDVIVEIFGNDTAAERKRLLNKCRETYDKFAKLKKNCHREVVWVKTKEFLRATFISVEQPVPVPQQPVPVPQQPVPVPQQPASASPSPSVPAPLTPILPPNLPNTTDDTPEPPQLKGDCRKCTQSRKDLQLLALRHKGLKKTNHHLRKEAARIKREYSKRNVDQRSRRHASRRHTLQSSLRDSVISHQRTIKKLKRADTANRSFQKTSKKLEKEIITLQKRLAQKGTQCENLQRECHAQALEIERLRHDLDQAVQVIPTKEGRSFSPATREAIYHMLCHQVPVTACGPVLDKVISTMTGRALDAIPQPSTAAQMAYELAIISSLQVAETLLSAKNLCISWDSTSADGSHINEVHITSETSHLVLDVRKIVGGRAEDYQQHILSALGSIAAIHGKYKDTAVATETLQRFYGAISCTLTDRAVVNSAVVRLIREQLGSELVELHCNVHPLDQFAHKCRAALNELQPELQAKCFGKEGPAANLIQAVAKIRYKATGDPEGFKAFLKEQNLPAGYVLRYVGNRLHVLMHSAGILLHLKPRLLEFLMSTCTAPDLLRNAVIADCNNLIIMDHVWGLALVGKLISGPWMTLFYSDAKSNLDMIPILQESKLTLESWAESPGDMVSCSNDIFGNSVPSDTVVKAIQAVQPTPFRLSVAKTLVQAILRVFETQLAEYTNGRLSSLPAHQRMQCQSARTHNMKSERVLGLWDGIWRRAPNASPSFIAGKVQCRLNCTLDWLAQRDDKKQMIQFAVSEGYVSRQHARTQDVSINAEIELRRQKVARKRDSTKRNGMSIRINRFLRTGEDEHLSGLPEDIKAMVSSLRETDRSICGVLFTHVWEEESGEEKTYCGRVRGVKALTKSQQTKLRICYWLPEQQEAAGEDYLVPAGHFFADMAMGDLSLIH